MVELTSKNQIGNFTYTNGTITLTGSFKADADNTLVNITANYEDVNVNMYYDVNNDMFQYYINGLTTEKIIEVSEILNDAWEDVSNNLNSDVVVESEEEQSEQEEELK